MEGAFLPVSPCERCEGDVSLALEHQEKLFVVVLAPLYARPIGPKHRRKHLKRLVPKSRMV